MTFSESDAKCKVVESVSLVDGDDDPADGGVRGDTVARTASCEGTATASSSSPSPLRVPALVAQCSEQAKQLAAAL